MGTWLHVASDTDRGYRTGTGTREREQSNKKRSRTTTRKKKGQERNEIGGIEREQKQGEKGAKEKGGRTREK